MITESFDDKSPAIISPASFIPEQNHFCDIAIGTFSREIHAEVIRGFKCEQIGELRAANHLKPIWLVNHDGLDFALYLTEIGSAMAATDMIEMNWLSGATKFILFGSTGSLDNEKTQGRYIIPTEAYRDEGMSYHYAPPSDYIKIRNADFVKKVFAENALPRVSGRVWTTDAFYRETRSQLEARKREGCIAVDMETAGAQAVCDFHGFDFFCFLVAGDVVDQPDYTPEGLHEANHSMDKYFAALKLAESIRRQKRQDSICECKIT